MHVRGVFIGHNTYEPSYGTWASGLGIGTEVPNRTDQPTILKYQMAAVPKRITGSVGLHSRQHRYYGDYEGASSLAHR